MKIEKPEDRPKPMLPPPKGRTITAKDHDLTEEEFDEWMKMLVVSMQEYYDTMNYEGM